MTAQEKNRRKARKDGILLSLEHYFSARGISCGVYYRDSYVSSDIVIYPEYNEGRIDFDYSITVYPEGFLLKGYPPVMIDACSADEKIRKERSCFFHAVNKREYCTQFVYDALKTCFITIRSYVSCEVPPSDGLIERCFTDLLQMLTRYNPGINAVIFGGACAAGAFRHCVPDQKDEDEIPDELVVTEPAEIENFKKLWLSRQEAEAADEDEEDPDDFVP